ncbi:MAG: hypothetical protein ACREU3_00695 [Steroidobacteraceae bacterium]
MNKNAFLGLAGAGLLLAALAAPCAAASAAAAHAEESLAAPHAEDNLAAPHAEETRRMPSSRYVLHYVHLYSGARGISHFRDERLTLRSASKPGPAGKPAPASQLRSAGRSGSASVHDDASVLSAPNDLISYTLSTRSDATLLLLKRGAKEDWHRAPRRMWLIVVQGMARVTAGDGEVRRFGPGSVLLMDDTTGKGHITQAIGKLDHIALTIPAPLPAASRAAASAR